MHVSVEISAEYTKERRSTVFKRSSGDVEVEVSSDEMHRLVNKAAEKALSDGYDLDDIDVIHDYFIELLTKYIEENLIDEYDIESYIEDLEARGYDEVIDEDILDEDDMDVDDFEISHIPSFGSAWIDKRLDKDRFLDLTEEEEEPDEYITGCTDECCRAHTIYLVRRGEVLISEVEDETLANALRKEMSQEEVLMTDEEVDGHRSIEEEVGRAARSREEVLRGPARKPVRKESGVIKDNDVISQLGL